MADNVAITAGSGTTIATDQLSGGEHVQKVKLLDGAADSSAAIGGDATYGLDVDVTRVGGVVDVEGNVAHDSADSGAPVKVGAKAIAHGSNPTAVAADDRTDLYANRAGVLFVMGGHPNAITLEYRWTTAQTDEIVLVSSGAKIVVTRVTVTIDEATTVGVGFRLGFGASALATLATDGNTASGIIVSHGGLVPGGGITVGDGSGILGIGADGEDLRITTDAATSGDGRCYITYYTIES